MPDWRYDEQGMIVDTDGNCIADGGDEEVLQRIVREHNAFPELLSACEKIQHLIEERLLVENMEGPAHITGLFCADLLAAIAKAKGEKDA